MQVKLGSYKFSKILGWSNSRYELFKKCKRAYYYTYYPKFVQSVPVSKVQFLKSLTTVPLEIGNVVHHIIETFLKRLQKSNSAIEEVRFIQYGLTLCQKLFTEKTFLEEYYNQVEKVDLDFALNRIEGTLNKFLKSEVYSWIFMKALHNSENWIVEPDGFGETRINGLKAYSKMDFLFPVDDELYILDWKSGKKDIMKHTNQLLGYAVAIKSENPHIDVTSIFPQIVYMSPEKVEAFEISITPDKIESYFATVAEQTKEMHSYCVDIENNIPHPIEQFPQNHHKKLCHYCQFQELCQQTEELPF